MTLKAFGPHTIGSFWSLGWFNHSQNKTACAVLSRVNPWLKILEMLRISLESLVIHGFITTWTEQKVKSGVFIYRSGIELVLILEREVGSVLEELLMSEDGSLLEVPGMSLLLTPAGGTKRSTSHPGCSPGRSWSVRWGCSSGFPFRFFLLGLCRFSCVYRYVCGS